MDLTKYPINERGFTVIPCIALTQENMTDDLIGFTVTIGLSEVGVPTSAGVIEGYTETHLKIRVGSKVKKYEYQPENIELQVYQFSKRIMFSNTRPTPRHIPEEKEKPTPDTKAKKTNEVKKKPRKSTKAKPKKANNPTQSSERYKPKHGIIWEN